jgi:hypothetical protein
MDVLAQVDAARSEPRQDCLERRDLLEVTVAAVIDHDVQPWDLSESALPKGRVSLIADEHVSIRSLVCPARRFQIDAVEPQAIAEVSAPHVDAPTAEDPDLEQMHLGAYEARKVAFVDIEVVAPLP